MNSLAKTLSSIKMENALLSFANIKVQDQIKDYPRKVRQFHYCKSKPKQRKDPKLVGLSQSAANMLGLDYQGLLEDPQTAFYLSGTKRIPNSIPLTHNYCGYQFGVWAGQLGDGRAHTLGSIIHQDQHFQLQLKGSGVSPFSRHADGNSVVSSAVRQFLASELMAGLGVPTTRALSLVVADENVVRDPFYNGKLKNEKAAIVLRIAPSFLRFGSFQVCKEGAQCDYGNSMKNREHLQAMADFLLEKHYKDIKQEQGDKYELMFVRIIQKTAQMVAHWQSFGFVHGVLNTDNISMVNVTIDYGPFAFIDYFSKDYISNLTDEHERYSFRQQPATVKWNLQRLAQVYDYLVPKSILMKKIDQLYDKTFKKKYYELMSERLCLDFKAAEMDQISKLVDSFVEILHECGTHYTNSFRILQQSGIENRSPQQTAQLLTQYSCPTEYHMKNIRFFQHLAQADVNKILQHDSGFNPYFISEQMLRVGRINKLRMQDCKSRTQYEQGLWINWLNNYNGHLSKFKAHNNKCVQYVLLNEIAVKITRQLQNLDIKEQQALIQKVLQVFKNPYQKNKWFEEKYWNSKPDMIKLTCSS